MLVKTETYTDKNGIKRKIDSFGPNKDTITSTVDSPVPQEIDYPESEPAEYEPEISNEEIQAQIILNQAEIAAKQAEQDEVLAEMLLQQTVKQQEQDAVLAAILFNQMKGGESDV